MDTGSDVTRPRLIYGTAWKKERTAGLVETALREGFRAIDTACQPKHYHEAGVGEGVAAFLSLGRVRRAELYLQTKFTPIDGQDPERVPYDPDAPLAEQIVQSFQESLRNLRTDYLDCLVLHSPLRRFEDTLEAWRAMEELVDAGGVRQIGLSNCYAVSEFRRLHDAARVKPGVLQNRFYAETNYDRELHAFCAGEGVAYQSFWTLTANRRVLAHATLSEIAATHSRTPAQVFFRHLTQQGVTPLTGTTSIAHMREDLGIFAFELTVEERRRIGALLHER